MQLNPSQKEAFEKMKSQVKTQSITALSCKNGLGRTLILKEIAKTFQAKYIRLADVFESIENFENPLKVEEGFLDIFKKGWKENDILVIDDMHTIYEKLAPCSGTPARPQLLKFAFDSLLKYLEKPNKKLIIGFNYDWHLPVSFKACYQAVELRKWTAEDFKHLLLHYGGQQLEQLDFEQVFRFAKKLNGYQLKQACTHLTEVVDSTEAFLDLLETKTLISNVNTEEVTVVSFNDLFGADEVIQQLEIDLITPIERPDLVNKLGISPKRGILLYGPPGTGKTTIGRALAHRLKSKFFLIDGTVISGTNNFYDKVHSIFEKAKANAPCILFIDDSDLLFGSAKNSGLYRYLLTMLDGLESESNEAVTVFMTAMNVSSLPPALIRSGRVELWLEMQLPDVKARKQILEKCLQSIFLNLNKKELTQLAKLAEGLTGADLKRVCTDAINRYGYDVANDLTLHDDLFYLEKAVEKLLDTRKKVINDRNINIRKEKSLPHWMA